MKLLDNNTNSLVKSRYSNKLLNDCKLIILTSVQTLDELYFNLKEHDTEPIEQLKRRCTDYVVFTDDTMSTYHYDEDKKDYVFVADLPNMTNQIHYIANHVSMLDDMKNIVEDLKSEPF